MCRSLFAAITLVAITVQAATPEPSAAAKYASRFSIASIKQAQLHRPSKTLHSECIASQSDALLVAEYDELLRAQFSPPDLAQLNTFLSSSAASKYLEDTLRAISAKALGVPLEPVPFSAQERSQLDRFLASQVGEQYLGLFQVSNQAWNATVRPALTRMLDSCR